MVRGLFVTGTNTEVGKTFVTALVAKALVAAGRRVGVYKPVASGCVLHGSELISEDAVALWNAAGRVHAANTMVAGRVQPGGPMTCLGVYDANLDPVRC